MKDLIEIFSSKAKLSTLLILYRQSIPIPLRHIAHIADIPVYSVQNALRELIKLGVVRKKKSGKYVLLCLNREHPIYEILAILARAISSYDLRSQANKYKKKAISALEFSSSAGEFFNDLRKH